MKQRPPTRTLKCFTVMELVVAMLISSLVVSIAYAGFQLVTAQLRSLKGTADDSHMFLLLNRALASDIDTAHTLLRTEDGLACKRADMEVNYRFADTAIVRTLTDGRADTFRFEQVGARFQFETALQDTAGQLLDALDLHLVQGADTLSLHLSKTYDRQTLFYFSTESFYERH